jgi:hypothetical protein
MIASARVYTRTRSAAAPGDGLALQNTPWSRGERPGVRRHPGYASEPGKRELRAEMADVRERTIVGARAHTRTRSEAAPGGGLLQDNPRGRGARPGVRWHPGYPSEPGERGLRADMADTETWEGRPGTAGAPPRYTDGETRPLATIPRLTTVIDRAGPRDGLRGPAGAEQSGGGRRAEGTDQTRQRPAAEPRHYAGAEARPLADILSLATIMALAAVLALTHEAVRRATGRRGRSWAPRGGVPRHGHGGEAGAGEAAAESWTTNRVGRPRALVLGRPPGGAPRDTPHGFQNEAATTELHAVGFPRDTRCCCGCPAEVICYRAEIVTRCENVPQVSFGCHIQSPSGRRVAGVFDERKGCRLRRQPDRGAEEEGGGRRVHRRRRVGSRAGCREARPPHASVWVCLLINTPRDRNAGRHTVIGGRGRARRSAPISKAWGVTHAAWNHAIRAAHGNGARGPRTPPVKTQVAVWTPEGWVTGKIVRERPNPRDPANQVLSIVKRDRDGRDVVYSMEWQPLYPTLRVPGSNPQSLPELKAYHGLGRVELPGLALACAPSTSTPATSVIVAPGGAYKFVGVPGKPEADSVLEWLCATGDAAVFVLKYRVPSVGPPATPSIFGGLPWGEPALMDAQRAVRLVRWWAGHNQSLKLDPLRVGFLGLSAGAHLVAHLAWRHDERLYARLDAVDEENALPDFQILVYPWNLERLAPSSRWLGGSRSCGSPATRRGRCRRSGYARGATRRPRC